MSLVQPAPASRRWYFLLRLVLIAAIVGALVYVNRQYFFHEQVYDDGDQAANSLSILRAERGQEIYGNYSRWQFHHPGPAVFYGEAAAELVLYRWLHVVPTPLNAQILFVTLLLTSLFAAGLSVAARWVRSPLFLVLALTFAVLHFSGADVGRILTNNWPPFVIPMALFALLIATASVAAGEGRDLPLLVFAGCLLLHMHVAQPLFVGPMFALAYLGLAWCCWRQRRAAATPASPPLPVPSGVPWRVYRRAHRWSLVIAALFALPVLVDLCFGAHSNFHLILQHLREHHGERHPYADSLDYLLRYAVYQPSLAHAPMSPAPPNTDAHLLGQFALRHTRMLLVWAAALLSPLLPWVVRRKNQRAPTAAATVPPARFIGAAPAGRWRFLGVLFLVWALSVGLTLFWGHIQDGPMFYFNAWFNYAIFFVLALLAAGALADAVEAATCRVRWPALWRGGVALLCVALAGFTIQRRTAQYSLEIDTELRAYTRTVLTLLAHEPPGTPRAKLLLFPHSAWGVAAGLAETIARADRPVDVLRSWEFIFGRDHVLPNALAYATGITGASNPRFEVWRLLPSALVLAGTPQSDTLDGTYTLVRGLLPVDPAAGFAITCAGPAPNCAGYLVDGWSEPTDGEPAWADQKIAWLQFAPRPVPAGAGVALTFDYKPYLPAGKRTAQRLKLSFNGTDLGTLSVNGDPGTPNEFVVPGDLWNQSPSALVTMEFPDAISPQEVSGSQGDRSLSFQISSLKFTLHTPVAPPGQNP